MWAALDDSAVIVTSVPVIVAFMFSVGISATPASARNVSILLRRGRKLKPERLVTRDNMTHGRGREMRPAHQHIGLAITVEKGATSLTGLRGIAVSPHNPAWLDALHWAMDHIPSNHPLHPVR